jgi:nickel-dependent lactate racemase
MAGERLAINFGKQPLEMTLPDGWRVRQIAEPAPYPALDDPEAACREALARPIGLPPLVELARGKRKVALIVDDLSRPTPVARFIQPVMDALREAGVPDEAVTIITGLGVHRSMTEDEVRRKAGPAALGRYRWVNHNFELGDHLEHLGVTRRGTKVYLNKEVTQADLVLSLGCVEPHIIASFGGGAKGLVPGVAGKVTVAGTHRINTTPATFNNVGLDPDCNPMRQDLEECVAMLKPPVFVVNAVLRGDLQITRLVAGHPVAAHREGVKTAAEIFGARVGEPAEVVITSSHPMNLDMRQGVKALANTIRALKRGGTMVCLLAAEQGVGDFPVPKKRPPFGPRGLKRLAGVLLRLLGWTTFGMQEEAHFFIYFTLQTLKNYHVVFYGPTIPADVRERLPFYEFHTDVQAALASAARVTPRGEVLVFPNGGVTYPILDVPC